ncbi:platelet binding protein GspB-like isoform X2 [Branchiostoma lanceolatum]|uniref:platelet binding protein GspB-like isoform X2 n=1 Tax=Branchiostoma lanceolatum TaxID=7740 RepID=UPI003456DFE4
MAVREERNIWELLGVGKDGEVSAKPAGDGGTSAEAFLAAIRSSDIKRIQRTIEKGSDINAKLLPDGSTPLHLACREGFHDVVDYLIVKGADINIRDSAGKTALQYQAQAANSTSASNGTLQASEEQPEEAADEVNQLTAKPASRCNGQDNIGNKRTAESATTSSLSQDIRPPLAASTPNLMKLHSLKQALSTTQGKRKREGKDQSFSGIKRIPGQNGVHSYGEGTRARWSPEAKRISSKDLGAMKHMGGDERHNRTVAQYTPTPIATLNGSKAKETDDSADEMSSSAMTVTLPGSIINAVSKVNGNSTIKSSRTPEKDDRKSMAVKPDNRIGYKDPRMISREVRYAGIHVTKDPRLASRKAVSPLLKTASESSSVGHLRSSGAHSNHDRVKPVREEHPFGSQPKKVTDEKVSESSVQDTEQQNSQVVRRQLKVYSSSKSKERREALNSRQNARSMAEEIARDLLHIIPLPEVTTSGVTLQSSESIRTSSYVRTLKDNGTDASDEENSRRPPPLIHKSVLTSMSSEVERERHDIPPTMTRATEYEMETHHKSMAKSEASQNDSMSDLTTPLQIRIPKPREAILQRHALPPELSPQGDNHLLQTCTGDDNGPLDLSLKRNGSTASHVQSAANSKTRNTLQPPVLSPKPIPPIPSSLEMASLRTRSSPALLSPDIARSPVPIMQDSPLSETARHSPNTVMYNPLTLPIARGLSGRPEQPQILPPLPRCEKMSHLVAPNGASTVHGIPMATVVPSVVRNWGGYVQNGNGVSEGVPSNVFVRPSASDMMGLLASASVLTRRTPTLEQLLKTPSMVNKSQSAPVLSTAAAAQSATTASGVAATIHPMAAPVQSTAAVSSPPMTISKHLADSTLVRPVATSTHLAAHPITSAFKYAVQPLMSSSQSTGVLNLQSATMPSLPAAVGPLPLDKDSHEASALMKAYSTFEHTPAKTATQTFSCLQDAPARSLSQDRPSTVRTPKKEVQLEGAVSRNNDVKTSSSSGKIHESSKLTLPVSSQHPVLAVPPMVVDSGSSPSERNIWSKLMPLGPPANSPRNLANSPRDAREQEVAEILSNMSTPLGSPAPPPMESPTPSPHPSRPCTPSREGRTLLGEGDSKHVGAFPCLESMLQKPPLSLSNNTANVSTPNRTTSTMQQSTVKTRFSPPAKIKTSPESKTRTSIPGTIRPGTDSKAQQPFSDKHSTETANRPNEPVCADKPSMPTIKTEVTETKAVKEQANVSPMRMSRSPHSRPSSTCIRTTPANIAAILSMKSNLPPQRALYPLVTSNTNMTTNSVSASGFPLSNLGFSITKISPPNSSSGNGPSSLPPTLTSSAPSTTTGVSQSLDTKYSHSHTNTLSGQGPILAGKVVSQCTEGNLMQSRDIDKVSPIQKEEKEGKFDVRHSTADLSTTEPIAIAPSAAVSSSTPNNQSEDSPVPVREAPDRSESVTSSPEAVVVLDTTTNGFTRKSRKFTKASHRARRREDRLKEIASKSQRTAEQFPGEKSKVSERMSSDQDEKDCQREMSDYSTDNRRDSESSAFSDTADTNMDGLHHRRYGRRSGTLSPRQQREFRRLKDSEGFVRDKKPPKTMNLYEDTSLLGREQRYLQRAMMRFQEMELADKGLPVEAVVRKTPSNKPVGVAGTRGRGGRYISSRHSCDTGQHPGPDRPHKAWHPRGRRRGMWQRGVERPRKIKRAVSRTSECSNNAEAASSSDLTKETGDTTAQQQRTSAHSSNSISRNPGMKEESELFRPEMIYSRKNHLVVRKPGFQDFYPTILPTRTRGVAAANFSKYARKAGQNGSTTSMKMEAHRRARRHWARKAAAAESQQNDDDPEKSGFVDLNNLKVRINLKDLYRSNMAQQRKKLLKKCCSSTANPKVIPEQIEAQLSPKIKIQKCLVTEGPSSKGRYFARRTGGHPAFTYKVTSCNMSPSPVPECTADIPQEEAQEVRKRPGRKRGPPKALSEDVADLSTKPGGKRKYKSRHLEPEEEPVPIPARAPEEEIPAVDMEMIHIKQEPLSDEDTVEYDQPEEEQEELEEEEEEVPHPDLPPMPPEMKKLLIQKSSGETVLHRASRLGYEEVVRYCLETRYVEVNSQDNAGYSPLHEACVRGHMAIVQDLILFGGDVNCSAQDGTRPIHDAVENDHVEIVRMLLSYGADPCLATYSGRTISSLCRSETMERFITDHFRDLAGREENDSNEGTWEFSGSCAIMEDRSEGNGMDVFADIPKEEESDLDDFEFEMSERPHLPSYNLLINLREGCRNYLLVDDVITQLEISREQLMAKLANQAPVCVSKRSFLTQISESQVTEVPSGLVGCSGQEEPSRNSPPLSATDSTSPGAVQEKDQEVPGGTSFAKSFPFGERKVPDQVHTAENNCSSSQGDVKTTLENETTLGSYDYEVNLERGDERNLSDTLLAIGDLREDARHTDDDQTTDTYMKIGQELNSERQASGVLEHENVEQGYSGMESDVSIEVDKHEDQSSCVYENGSDQSLDQLSRKKEENTDEEENQPFSTKDSATVCKLQTTDGDADLCTTEILDRTETADGETYIDTESERSAVADQSWAGAEKDQDRDMSSCSTTEGQSEYGEFEGRDASVEEASHVRLTEENDSMVERTEGQLYEENHETSSTSGSSDEVHIKETAMTEGDTLQNDNSPPTSDIAGSSHGDTETNSSPPTSDIVGSSHGHTQSPNVFGTENLNVWLDTNSSNQSNDELIGQSEHEPAGNQSEQSTDVDSVNLLVKLGVNESAVRTEPVVTRYSDGIVCSFDKATRKTEEPVVELLELTSDLKELLGILTEKL